MKLHAQVLAMMMCCTVLPGVAATGYAEALAAYDKKDFATALREFDALAARGSAKAQHNLGVMHERGEGVKQDYKVAIKWYRLAADQGLAASQYSLGLLFETEGLPHGAPQVVNDALRVAGVGIPRDYTEAVKWYRAAAEQGYGPAQSSLGVMYAKGHGVKQDDAQAVKWFRSAAETGNYEGAFNLGICYKNGQGVASDQVTALAIFNLLAAGRSDSRASRLRDELSSAMTAREVETAQQMTQELRVRGNFLRALDRADR